MESSLEKTDIGKNTIEKYCSCFLRQRGKEMGFKGGETGENRDWSGGDELARARARACVCVFVCVFYI